MGKYVSAKLRRLVAARAEYLCEYCLINEEDRGFGCQIDHIVSEKHGGRTEATNLAHVRFASGPKEVTLVLSINARDCSPAFTIRVSMYGLNIFGWKEPESSLSRKSAK